MSDLAAIIAGLRQAAADITAMADRLEAHAAEDAELDREITLTQALDRLPGKPENPNG